MKTKINYTIMTLVTLLCTVYINQLQAQTNEYFKTTWNTQTGDPGNATIKLPIFGGAYDVDVNNDGDFDDAEDMTNVTGFHPITFLTSGKYTIGIRPNPDNNTSNQLRISHYADRRVIGTPQKLISIDKWGDIVWTSMDNAFRDCSNMTFADNVGVPDLSMVTSMRATFFNATGFNGNISNWDVSKVQNMAGTFQEATSFNGDLSAWNVSNVGYMGNTFKGASSFNGNLSNWDVSKVENMAGTFQEATSFNGDLSAWNVSKVTNMQNMFTEATSFNQDLSGWNVSNVGKINWNPYSMENMFFGATSFSSENYDALLTGWSNLTPQNNVTFGAPPTTYCAGEAGKDILINTYSWNITGDMGLSCPVAPFVTTWRTETDNMTIELPIIEGAYDVDVNGDGDFDDAEDMTNVTGFHPITFLTSGKYTIGIRPNPDNNTSNQLRISHYADRRVIGTPQKLISIDKWGDIVWTSMDNAFRDCSNMTFADNVGVPDLSMVTSMRATFFNATGFNGNISNWDVSKVQNMAGTFQEATSFNGDLSAWNVSNVGYMGNTFKGASSFNGNLSNWDVSKVENMAGTFQEATSFNGDLSAWNVSKVTNMQNMFTEATSFNQDLSGWNVSNVGKINWNPYSMENMFFGATSFSSENYDALLTGWSNLTPQNNVTFGAPPTTYCAGEAGKDILINTYSWNITGDMGLSCPVAPFVTTWRTETDNMTIELPIIEGAYDVDVNGDGDFDDAEDMTNVTGFHPITFLTSGKYTIGIRPNPDNNTSNQLRISHYADRRVIGTPQKLISIDKWGDIVWTSMDNAFRDCSNMTFADNVGVPDLSMVTSMRATFFNATGFNGNISNWDVSKVQNMAGTFQEATSFNGDLSAWNVSNVGYMGNTFKGASSFNGNLSNWDVSKVENMAGTFQEATSFNGDLSAWNVSKVTNMQNMFTEATSFNQDLSGWNVSNVGKINWNPYSMENMFFGATSFSSENYDALLTGWSNLTPQNNVTFGAPPTTYCAGEAGRNTLINTYNWDIQGDNGLSCPVAPFVTRWNTELGTGQTGNKTIELPITTGAYDVDVNNDGDFDDSVDLVNQTGTITIDFGEANAGVHTIAVRPNPDNNARNQLRIRHYDDVNFREIGTPQKLVSIDKWGDIVWTSMEKAFRGCSNMTLADNAGVPDLTIVQSTGHMFKGASSFNGDLSKWNVSSVERMSYMLDGAINFNGNVSTWNVSNVTETKYMFRGAANFNGNINNWDVSNVKYMHQMFHGASDFNGNISTWNVSNVQYMHVMFRNATSFKGNLSRWNVSNVRNMAYMFRGANSFNGNISTWNVSNVTSMDNMFRDAPNFNGDLSTWNVSNVNNTGNMFWGATKFNGDLSTWNVSNVTDMRATFLNAANFSGNLSDWNVSNVRDMEYMFYTATSFNGNISNWNVSNVTNMSATFAGAKKFNGDLNAWNVSNVTRMLSTFRSATSFNGNLSNWDVSNVGNMEYMFRYATSFDGNVSTWDITKVTNMHNMFFGATNFNEDLSTWNVSNVTNMKQMFFGATNFNGDLSTWSVSNVTDMADMLSNATSFSSENYDALLTGWSSLPSLQDDVPFGAPPTTYCAGEAGRNTLINTNNWDIQGDNGLSCPVAPFVTRWNTEAGEQTGNTTIVLPITEGAYDVDVNNDGDFDDSVDLVNQTGTITIDFREANAGVHTIAVRPNPDNNARNQLRISHYDDVNFREIGTPQKLVSIDKWGDIVWTSMEKAFRGCSNMTLADNAGVPDLTIVQSTGHMFKGASSFNGDLSKWNVSSVERMSYMLDGASSFNGNVSTWNVSNVTETKYMFKDATSFNGNISNWNVSNVTNMKGTFWNASFNGNISTWNVSNVQYMHVMFTNATKFNGNLSGWNVSNVQRMDYMFRDATNFTSDLSTWNVSNVTSMDNMFRDAPIFNGNISTWNVSNVRNMAYMFRGAPFFNGDLSTWNVSNVTSMEQMFSGATNFSGNLSDWNVSNVRDMEYMFYTATSFNGNISNWNVSNVTNMSATFAGAKKFNGDLNAWNVSNVTRMLSTFRSATSFNGNLSNWDVSNVGNMEYMFRYATSFDGNVSTWDITKVTNMHNMFFGATNFNEDLSTWNVSNVTNMKQMFFGATNFNGDLSTWSVSNVTDMADMLSNATSFSSENYDALLTGWSSLPSLQDDVPFGAPPTTYCAGEAGRNTLINTNNWDISGDTQCSRPKHNTTPFLDIKIDSNPTNDDEFLNTRIYPNPTDGKISIESPFEIEKLELYNVLGAKIFSVSKTNVLDLTSLRQGIYILKVFSGDRVISKKVIKD